MVRATLWAEIMISGFIFLLGIIFTFFCICQVKDLNFLKFLKDYPALSPLIIIVFSYIIGFFMHRLIYAFFILKIDWFRNNEEKKMESDSYLLKKIYLAQHGSERLNIEIQYQFNNYALSRLMLLGVPFLLISFSYWFFIIYSYEKFMFAIVLPVILIIIIILRYIKNIQRNEYFRLLSVSFEELNKMNKPSS